MPREEQGFLGATHVIRTPELVEFEFELAGLYSRFLAWLIDGCISAAIITAAVFAISLLGMLAEGLAGFLTFIVIFLVNWGYFAFCEWWSGGRTPGKKALGLRVMQVNGVRIELAHAILRNLLRPFDSLPFFYAVGGAAALLSPSRRRLGDLVAGTVVVRERRRKAPGALATAVSEATRSGSLAGLRDRLRRATVAEREVLLSAALRRDELSVNARLSLFGELAAFLRERFGIEKPDHLSDEKVVVEAVGCLLELEGAAQPAVRKAVRR